MICKMNRLEKVNFLFLLFIAYQLLFISICFPFPYVLVHLLTEVLRAG